MEKTPKTAKLKLSVETIRTLSETELREVATASGFTICFCDTSPCPSRGC